MIRYCEKKIDKKSWYPLAPLIYKFLRYQKISETLKSSPTKILSTVTQRSFDRKTWYPLLMHKTFRYQKFSEAQKGFLTKFFGTARQKTFDRKVGYQDLCIKFFDTRNFLTNRRVPLRNAAVLREKLNGKSCYLHHNRLPPHLLRIKNFNTWIFMKHKKVSPRNFSVLWNKKPRQKIVIYPSYA